MVESQKSEESGNVQYDQKDAKTRVAFSPRKVAKAIGVSESSLKRWCDAGFLAATKTAGGHRRISRSEVIAFVQRKQMEIAQPELIGLPALDDIRIQSLTDASHQLHEALLGFDEHRCHRLLTYLYIQGHEMASIFDQVVAPAFVTIGDEWKRGDIEVFQERRACQTCLAALHELRAILPAPLPNASTALGGSLEQDQYMLPTAAVEMTLTSLGWNAESMGTNLPVDTLQKAAELHRPHLLWISVSYLGDPAETAKSINRLASSIPEETTLIMGGNAIDAPLRSQLKNVVCCDNHSQLVASIRGFNPKTQFDAQ